MRRSYGAAATADKEGARGEKRQQSWSWWATTSSRCVCVCVAVVVMVVVVVMSQDGMGTINMVVMGKGELNRGRVSADIWRALGRRMAVSPTTAWPASQSPV